MKVLEPIPEVARGKDELAPRPRELNGKAVVFFDGWGHGPVGEGMGMYPTMEELKKLLEARVQLGRVAWVKKPNVAQVVPKPMMDRVVAQADVVINGQCL